MNLRQALRNTAIRALQVYFNLIDPLMQKRKLTNYENDVRSISSGNQNFQSAKYAILVYYEPNDLVSNSIRNLLQELAKQEVNVLTVANIPLSAEQADFITQHSWSVMIRGNQGLDFGAYQDAVQYLRAQNTDVRRLLLLNDSVYYFSRGLPEFVADLLAEEDLIAAFENWDPHHAHHVQSFALSVSGFVYRHQKFAQFWKEYIPYNSRLMAIERGEKRLSKACLSAARTTKVIYNASSLFRAVKDAKVSIPATEFYISAPLEVRHFHNALGFLEAPKLPKHEQVRDDEELTEAQKYRMFDIVSTGSPIHTSMYYFAKFARCPLVKKDIVFRKQYRFWEVEVLLRDIFNEVEMEEFLTMLRAKGDMMSLPVMKRAKTMIGAA